MNTQQIIVQFLFFAFVLSQLSAAVMVVVARNPVTSVLFLVLTFFASAGLWILLEAEFLGLILILVYVGAVMTLFLFVVMTLNINQEVQRPSFVRYLPYGIAILGILMGVMIYALGPWHIGTAAALTTPRPAAYSNVKALGGVLYTDYAYSFELAGVLLLVAIIAAISLTFRGRQQRKTVAVEQQINVRREDRVRLVKMAPERKKD